MGKGILAGAGRCLKERGIFVAYGPFKIDGKFTTESNEAFDASLRQRNVTWGYRDIADVAAYASLHGLRMRERRSMPANNFLVVFERS